jgi:Ca2+-binding EF-hand superfamily protein
VDETIKNLRAHPMLLALVLKQGDESIRQAVLNKELIATAFREADTDGDGTISASEQTAYLKVRRYGNSFSEYGNIPTPSTATAAPAAKGTEDAEPTPLQLRRYSLLQFLPFVVFGILDNGIMVIAGNQIDDMFGVMLGLSTMASAGLGNLISDVVGVRAAGSVEDGAERVLPDPRLTEAQAQNPKVRFVSNYAKIVGISLGCLIGLTPLLFMEDEDTRQLRKLYEAIDTNKDGGVSLGELENTLSTLGSSFDVSFSRATIEKIFDEIDSDRSKLLSFDEFKAFAMRWKTLENELVKKS